VFQRQLLAALLNSDPLLGEQLNTSNDGNAQLTARELEVVTAMADGATNKAIARRLGISFHTVNFTSPRFLKNSTLTLGQKL
jgi:DNA-binding NarL/FixJ family response regulator